MPLAEIVKPPGNVLVKPWSAPPEGELTGDFVAMLLVGRDRGYLTPDDLLGVMESVELTPGVIATAVAQRHLNLKYTRADRRGRRPIRPRLRAAP